MKRDELLHYLNKYLNSESISDYCPNGLQVAGSDEITNIVCAVTASEVVIDHAIEQGADCVLVHHGYFWKGEDSCITGIKRNRLAKLLKHNINLVVYHLPLDVHPDLGNNKQLAEKLDITITDSLDPKLDNLVLLGTLNEKLSGPEFADKIEMALQRKPLHLPGNDRPIQTVAWCTGAGQSFIELAAKHNVDAFISGEVSEHTYHASQEYGIHYFAAGHHASERYGIQALGHHIEDKFELTQSFFDIDNPV